MFYLCTNGRPFNGTLRLDGSKHGFAHVLSVALLSERIRMKNVPDNLDAQVLRTVIEQAYKHCRYDPEEKTLDCKEKDGKARIVIEEKLLASSRSIFGLLPGLLSTAKEVVLLGNPTGCEIGSRPTEWYLKILRDFGVTVTLDGPNTIMAWETPRAANIDFEYPTMTGTVIALAAAAKAPGQSTLRNCSVEPSCDEMCAFLKEHGIRLDGNLPELRISGARLNETEWAVSSDRVHAVTYLTAGLLSKGTVTVIGERDLNIPEFVAFLKEIGVEVRDKKSRITVRYPDVGLRAQPKIDAGSEPKFSSDWVTFAALLMAAHSKKGGIISDDVFTKRFQFSERLNAFGLDNIKTEAMHLNGRDAVVASIGAGVGRIQSGNFGSCPDIRGSATLALASILANGPCTVESSFQIRRGYSNLGRDLEEISQGNIICRTELDATRQMKSLN